MSNNSEFYFMVTNYKAKALQPLLTRASLIIGSSQPLHSVFVLLSQNSTPSGCSQGRVPLRSTLAKIRLLLVRVERVYALLVLLIASRHRLHPPLTRAKLSPFRKRDKRSKANYYEEKIFGF